ncbi:hypothetical protein OOK60_14600 [Trichothermofontia sichuanensis B231]|uniref:hypothetical protein n=1 Tax=Trichothermofontia sichuanensis TaxID=3045816 RepID=UPI002247C642|nr:hypothetical protein [Trichothermofontia sichuanensis]UZQ53713.1 hypothetical protein OOK60_14600 [Trichothermofontia sichuanensis B231]
MFHLFHSLADFSRSHCLSICAWLVPANLLTSAVILGLVGWRGLGNLVRVAVGVSSLWAGLMVLHVLSWFTIGVVQVPTFVLCGLAIVCLGINAWAIAQPAHLQHCLRWLVLAAIAVGSRRLYPRLDSEEGV